MAGLSGNFGFIFALICVHTSPSISIVLDMDRHKIATIGDNITFACMKEDAGSTHGLEWTYNRSVISECQEKPVSDEVCAESLEGGFFLRLWFKGMQKTFNGTYTCNEYRLGKHDLRHSGDVSVTVKENVEPTLEPTTKTPTTETPTTKTPTAKPLKHTTNRLKPTTTSPLVTQRTSVSTTRTFVTSEDTVQSTSTAAQTSSVIREYDMAGGVSNDGGNSSVVTSVAVALSVVFAVVCACIVIVYIWKKRNVHLRKFDQKTPFTDGGPTVLGAKYKQWEFCREQVQLLNKIGDGYFGTVWKAQAYGISHPGEWATVAVKMGKSNGLNISDEEETSTMYCVSLCEEAKILTDMGCYDNKNVVRLLGLCYKGGPMWLIFEHAKHGNLRCYLRSKRDFVTDQKPTAVESKPKTTDEDDGIITPWKMFNFALQIANGMKYLISRKVIHCDLAARNILVFDDELLKICDFGMAKDIRYVDYYRREVPCVVPAKWMSPEAMLDKLHTEFSDVWSFGILMWEIATLGGSPYPGVPVEKLYDLLTRGYRMSCPVSCPRSLYEEMKRCWAALPEERPTFETLTGHISHTMTEIKETQACEEFESGNGEA